MNALTTTLDEVVGLVTTLASDTPERVSEPNRYIAEGGTANDLTAHVLDALGFDFDANRDLLRSRDGRSRQLTDNARHIMFAFHDVFAEGTDLRVNAFLTEIQKAEDKGKTWSEALVKANRYMVRLAKSEAEQSERLAARRAADAEGITVEEWRSRRQEVRDEIIQTSRP